MLSTTYLGRNTVRGADIDLHRHAVVSCAISRFFARIIAFFAR